MEVLHAILIILMILSWTLWVHASRKKYRQLINPISLYTTIWLVPACFSITGFYNLFIPSPLTLLLVLINVWVFDLSCFCIKHREKGFSGEKQRKSNEDQLNTKRKRYTLLIISNCVCLLWLVPYIRAMLPYIVSGNWAYARSLYLLASTNHTVYTVSSSLFLQWIILPLFYTTALVSAYYVAKQKPNYILLIITVVDVAAIVMATAGRNVIMKVLLFYVFAFILINENKGKLWTRIMKSSLLIKVVFAIGIVLIGYITFQRKLADDTTIFGNIYTYFVGPMVYLDNIVKNHEMYDLFSRYLFGRATFGFISTPIEIVASRVFNFNYNGVDNIITTYVSQYVNISPTLRGNAFSTSIYPFMMDFGWFGIIISPIILGQFAARIFRVGQKTLEKNNEFWKCLMVFMFFVIFFSEWEYELIFPYTSFVVLYTYLFFYKRNIGYFA